MKYSFVIHNIRGWFGISGHFDTGYDSGFGVLCEDPRDFTPRWWQIWPGGRGDGVNDFKKIRYIDPTEGESRVVFVETADTLVDKGIFSTTTKVVKTREIKEILIRRDILITDK